MVSAESDAHASGEESGAMLVGVAGVGLSVAAVPISSKKLTPERLFLASLLLALHIAACVGFYFYSLHNTADAHGYYFNPFNLSYGGFGPGSAFALQSTQLLKHGLGASYMDCFLIFQAIGFWGLMLLMRSFQEIEMKMDVPESVFPKLLMFVPSLHFWTAAIGKDAPVFFGISLCTWAMLEFRRRRAALAFALFVILLYRPHIALLVAVSIGLAALVHGRMVLGKKMLLVGAAMGGAVFLAGVVQQVLRVNVMDFASIGKFFSDKNDIASNMGGTTTFGNASIPMRFIAIMFRPFFFEVDNMLSFIPAVENIGSMALFIYFMKQVRGTYLLSRRIMFIKFCVCLTLVLIGVLGLFNYNIGTGLRERVMVFPPLFCLFVASWALPRVKRILTRADRKAVLAGVHTRSVPAGASL